MAQTPEQNLEAGPSFLRHWGIQVRLLIMNLIKTKPRMAKNWPQFSCSIRQRFRITCNRAMPDADSGENLNTRSLPWREQCSTRRWMTSSS